MVGAARLVGKYGEKRTSTKKTLRLPWMAMGQRTDDSETRGSTTQGAEATMWEMDEGHALRVQRRKLVHEPILCGSQQRREKIGLECGGAPQQWIEEATGAMVTETEYEFQQEAGGLCQPGGCSYNGHISPGAQQNPQPAPPFGQCLSSFQYQQVMNRTEPNFSAEIDSIGMSIDGSGSEGNSHSGRKERDCKLAVKTRNHTRLRDSTSKSSRNRSSAGSRPM
ncbi:uncharacterized protein MONOS_13834 [Monocercomonoides exilis]|uniref:uncharacterized protein n=1 Tax=Monocercomonoides exilis TaxID=2049356 RepID=UPI00355A0312|nr:hypothetical protein MONOS_13834 [Monocercomonoides exilis]|eukprot:MONOS_13834.1-p1 / transcript=MONOS_13834.1 / gene=MONOS_13834 / organism=Monocercomonoides_exilis_PA203 / gene_product=unspecified product / transcript_product=unspecified product / location=Mono_scaffold00891:6470-7331(-) / protein_length=223 / sequence_SO=supercontig / SO=protein_coding / is_pseudo=false